jgi:formamidopyrimidine-DNA glycosylase
MPELPEAESIARILRERTVGKRIGAVVVARPDIVHGDPRPLEITLSGRRIREVGRRAKRVEIRLNGGVDLIVRLGMSGRLTVEPASAPVEPHTHLRISLRATKDEIRFRDPRRFGGVWCLTPETERNGHLGPQLGPVGIEPLEATFADFRRVLQRRRQIKALLMDQAAIAGLGNIYCDESLFAAGIHPLNCAVDLNHAMLKRLVSAIRQTLRSAIRHNGSTLMDYRNADGEPGSFQRRHRVYQREGLPCKRCHTPIRRIIAAGRSTFFCPKCQPKRSGNSLRRHRRLTLN